MEYGFLTIKASSAGGAIPIKGLEVIISDESSEVYKGITNESGVIENIKLMAPKNDNNMEIPKNKKYQIVATYTEENFEYVYNILVYAGLYMIQNINVIPNLRVVNI